MSRAHKNAPARRSYTSPLRASQRDATRRAIAEAAYELLRVSPDELTVPAIAVRAGVSVPTVNRHFSSRQALLEGVVAHIDSLGDNGAPREDVDPASFFGSGLGPLVHGLFSRFAAIGMPAGATSAAIMELRSKVTIPRRRRIADEAIAKILPGLTEPHRTWLSDLLVVLLSSSMVHTMQSYLALSPEESAMRMHWLLSILFAETKRMSEAGRTGRVEGRAPGARSGPGRASGSKRTTRKKGDRT